MAIIKNNNDLKVGMVLTCKNGDRYTVVADDNGAKDVISLETGLSNGIEVGTGKIAVCGGGSKGGRDVVKIEEFSGMPARNRLSEALKFLTKRRFTETLSTVWTAEDPAVTAAKAKVAAAQAAMEAAQRELARVSR